MIFFYKRKQKSCFIVTHTYNICYYAWKQVPISKIEATHIPHFMSLIYGRLGVTEMEAVDFEGSFISLCIGHYNGQNCNCFFL